MINEDALRSIEKLHEMKAAGILSEEEFAAAKQDLLQGKGKPKQAPTATSIPRQNGALTLEEHVQWALLPLRRYAQFEGRSGRREFWMFQLMTALTFIVLLVFSSNNTMLGVWSSVMIVVGVLGTIVPTVAVQVRRFHDLGKSGWFVLLNLIPLGSLVVLVFMALPGVEGENEYGPDPLAE